MKTAYLYVRVSTDEQKRKGYSLPEQEDRLIKYCRYNGIRNQGDFSRRLLRQKFQPTRMEKTDFGD